MKAYNINESTFAFIEQFIVESRLTPYEKIKIISVTQSEENPSVHEVVFHSNEDSQYHDSLEVEDIDLIAYIAFKSCIINNSK